MDTATITRNGRTIQFRATGRGGADRCIVFVPPAAEIGELDPDPEQTAKRDVLLVGIDQPENQIPIEAADDIADVLDHLGFTTAGVAGLSAGGLIAVTLAARRPDLVDRLVLLGTAAPDDNEVPLEFEPADVRAKTLLLYGMADGAVRGAHARWWKDRLANSRIEMMPGVGHDMAGPAWKRVLSHLAPGRKS